MTSSASPLASPTLISPTVSTQWLADHLGSDALVVLDATVLLVNGRDGRPSYLSGHDQYLVTGHIPGAVFADLIETFSDPEGSFAFTRPSAEQFEAAAAAAGISNATTVVVYDSAVGQWASRIWWLFRSFGHDRVAVLDGGLTKWDLEQRPTETGHVEPVAGSFSAVEHPEFWVDKHYVERVVSGEETAALVCAAPPKEFTGESGARPRLGHIPGSHSVPAGRLVDRETHAFLPAEELETTFRPALGESSRVVLYCGGGIAATSAALALTLAGHTDIAVYDGSLNEWAADSTTEVVSTHAA